MQAILQIAHIILVLLVAGLFAAWKYFSPSGIDETSTAVNTAIWSLSIAWSAIIIVTTIIKGVGEKNGIQNALIGHYRFLLTKTPFLWVTNVLLLLVGLEFFSYMKDYRLVQISANYPTSVEMLARAGNQGSLTETFEVGNGKMYTCRIHTGEYTVTKHLTAPLTSEQDSEPPLKTFLVGPSLYIFSFVPQNLNEK